MIPLLDMRDQRKDPQAFAKTLGDSLHTFGFVRLVGHGVPEYVINEAAAVGKKFWALPDPVKDRYSEPPYQAGANVGYARNKETALSSNIPDIKEEWGIRSRAAGQPTLAELMALPEAKLVVPEGMTASEAITHLAIKQRRDRAAEMLNLPEVPQFGDKTIRLFDAFEQLSVRVMRSIALYAGEKEDRFDSWAVNSESYMRLLHYPQAGNAAGHLDFNMLSFLDVDEPGLWVRDRKGNDHKVISEKGELILNGGMQLGLITNDYLRPSWHWVEAEKPRNSIPFFFHPHLDVTLEPLSKFAASVPRQYPSYFPPRDDKGHFAISVRDFNNQRLYEIYERNKPKPAAA